MNLRRSTCVLRGVLLRRALAASAGLVLACLVGSTAGFAQNAYITNFNSASVSVIDTATNTGTASILVGRLPYGVAVTPDGSKVYVTGVSTSVIDTATDTVIATIPVAGSGVSVTPNGNKVFVVTAGNTVSVIDGDQHGDRPPDPRWQRPRSIRSIHWTAKICRDAGV